MGEHLPGWFHQQQIESLTKLIDSETRQREALVTWMATIDANVEKWSAQVAEHQSILDAS